jgi:Bacteriophage replication gene A protein (GPA)
MTRIAGFERYADAEDDQGVFITLTCPSRFHRYMIVNDGKAAVPNPRCDEHETPSTAQKYLTQVWARSRAALAREGLRPYGFRICEPQHDGTPHWHMLLFCPPAQVETLMATLRLYALQDSGDEKGAQQHRCDFKLIDKTSRHSGRLHCQVRRQEHRRRARRRRP